MAELNEQSASASHAQRTSQQSNRPARWTAPCSRDDLFTSLFSSRLPLVCTRAVSENGAAPFFAMSLGVGGFSWPFRLAMKNHFFMRFFKGATPRCGRVPCNESRSVHQECVGPSPANAEAYSSDLSVDYDYGDQRLFACHKHIQEQDRGEGGTDTKEGEETFDDSKDSGQALSVHLSEDNGTGEHDSEEEEDDKWDYFDPIQPVGLVLEESGSIFSTLLDNDDDSDFIVFSDNPETVDTKPVGNRAGEDMPPQTRSLVHTVSYSSDESGFCENITDSSDEECEDSESEDDEIGVVVLDEDLWQELEQQVHFFVGNKPLSKPTVSTHKPAKKPSVPPHRSVSPELFIENTTVATTSTVHQAQKNTCVFDSMGDSETCNKKDMATVSSPAFYSSPPRHKTPKSVSFKPDSELVKVHPMVTWKFAYRECRRGPWEQIARDRDRFYARIEHTAKILNPCLKKHPSRQM